MNRSLIKLRLLFGTSLIATICGAQEPLPEGVYRVGNGVSPPRLIKKAEPQYSKEARMAHLEGIVTLRAIVSTQGKACDFQVLRSLGMGLDESAISAVSSWEFEPGVKDRQPVNVLAIFEENFRLREVRWILSRVEFALPAGAVRPIVEKITAPQLTNDAISTKATLTFAIDEKGVPVTIPFDEASHEGWSREVAAALSKWRFKPASQAGRPISVSCTMDFAREH